MEQIRERIHGKIVCFPINLSKGWMTLEKILIKHIDSIYELERKVTIDGSYYFVKLNGKNRCTTNLNKPFAVDKLPRGAKKIEQN